MAEKSLDYYRRILDEDRYEAPLTDSQKGEAEGIKTYNQMVPEVNKVTKTGEALRKNISDKDMTENLADKEAYDKMMTERQLERSPQSVNEPNFFEEILAPSAKNEIPLMTPATPNPGTISQAYVPKLSEINLQSRGSNVSLPKAPSTAPVIIPQEAIADKLVGTDSFIANNLRGAPAYNDTVQGSIQTKFDAAAAGAAAENEALAQQKKALEDQIFDEQEKYNEGMIKAEKQINSIGTIDPDRVWANRSTWSKLALAFGAAAQGANGRDDGMKLIQQIVSNDIEAQKANMASGVRKGQGMLDALKPLATNRLELMKMSNAISVKMAEKYGELLKSGVSRNAAAGMAIQETMKYTKELLALQNANNKNILAASGQEQKQRDDDNNWMMKNQQMQLDKARLKFDTTNMSETDARRLEGATAMAISAKRMKELENDKGFDPTSIKNAITSYMQGKGIPKSLSEIQSEYVMNYINYFGHERQALTGAAGSESEDERIKLMVAPDKTFAKKSIRLYQAQRARRINGAINSMNPAALSRVQNIPEFREFDVNRGKLGK